MANLRKKVPFGHLSLRLRLDVREFFGNYQRALKEGLELLYAAGDPGEIELACEVLKFGWQDEQALYVHRSLLDDLPPVLRAYIGCATTLFGDVAQADVIKLHKASGKVTFPILRSQHPLRADRPDGIRLRTIIGCMNGWLGELTHPLIWRFTIKGSSGIL